MIIDSFTTFSQAQTLSATGTTTSTNIIDLSAPRDIANGQAVKFYIGVATSFSQTGTGTVVAEIMADSSPTFNASPTVLNSATLAVSALLAGSVITFGNLSYDVFSDERYLQAVYIVQGTTLTAGAINAGLTVDAQADEYYPSGINVTGV